MEATTSKGDKILMAIAQLEEKRDGNKITVENVAVQCWKNYPDQFCMRGYSQYPNVDIQKYITKLLDNNLIKGGVYNYVLTPKGSEYVAQIKAGGKIDAPSGMEKSYAISRQTKAELNRIISSKVFKYFLQSKESNFLESDLFEFLGTSSRSLGTHNKNLFLSRYNLVAKDLIPYCRKMQETDENAKEIVQLWEKLETEFEDLIKKKV